MAGLLNIPIYEWTMCQGPRARATFFSLSLFPRSCVLSCLAYLEFRYFIFFFIFYIIVILSMLASKKDTSEFF